MTRNTPNASCHTFFFESEVFIEMRYFRPKRVGRCLPHDFIMRSGSKVISSIGMNTLGSEESRERRVVRPLR